MDKLSSVLKSTGRDLVIAACVAGTIYLLVQVFDQGELPQAAAPDATATSRCLPDADGSACPPLPAPVHANAPSAPAEPPLYVTVTVAP